MYVLLNVVTEPIKLVSCKYLFSLGYPLHSFKKCEAGYKIVCLIARNTVNKNNELNMMVEDIDPHIIGITESWPTKTYHVELGLTGYAMFRRVLNRKKGRGIYILYITESVQTKLEMEVDCDEAISCDI